ncbi:MAG: c-type cytochrome [Cellvibrionales bacterium]|jgi:cytochrome c oxidase subunit 2
MQPYNTARGGLAALMTLLLVACGGGHDAADTATASQTVLNANHPAATQYQAQCSACHSANALGNETLQAPALTSLDTDYLQRQLRHFRDGVRGAHADDITGKTMVTASTGLSDTHIAELADYIDSLPNARPESTLSGDLALGKDYHLNLCSACHGSNALGNAALEAPALAGLNDWYVLNQYENYRDKIRGAHPGDRWGVQMVRLAPAIEDPEILESIATYLASLPPEA